MVLLLADQTEAVLNQLRLLLLPTELILKIFDALDLRALLVCKEVGLVIGCQLPVSYLIFKGLPLLSSHHL